MNAAHGDFSELYRDALAERDPYNKAILLQRVTEALRQWEKELQGVGSDARDALVKEE